MSVKQDPRIVVLTQVLRDGQGRLERFVRRTMAALGRAVQAADVEDLISESYLKAIERLATDDPPVRDYQLWFKAFLRNECQNVARKRFRRGEQPLTEEMECLFEDAEALRLVPQLEAQDFLDHVDNDKDRSILEYFAQGFKSPEIAGRVGLEPATVRQRLRRALAQLRPLTRDHKESRP